MMLQESLCLLRDLRLVHNKEKEQSQKKKSASKGTGSPVLWQVGESAERPHGLP